MEKPQSFLTVPIAVLLGSLIISISILMSGGVIKFKGSSSAPTVGAPAANQPAAAPQQKTEADIIKNLKSYAQKLGLDTGKFNSCIDSSSKASLVKADTDDGSKVGVSGTPAFFVNGRVLSGAQPYEQFKTIIEEELNNPPTADRKTVSVGNLLGLGSDSAKVTIVEFSDYQCPFCERFYTQTEGQIRKDYVDTGKVKFYYRDFPLTQIHPGAQKGAEAARCAGDQGKYWQYHDLVFQDQSKIF